MLNMGNYVAQISTVIISREKQEIVGTHQQFGSKRAAHYRQPVGTCQVPKCIEPIARDDSFVRSRTSLRTGRLPALDQKGIIRLGSWSRCISPFWAGLTGGPVTRTGPLLLSDMAQYFRVVFEGTKY